MKKKEIKIIIALAIVAVVSIFVMKNPFKEKEPEVQVAIRYQGNIIQLFDPSVDATYTLTGSYGHVEVEVLDGAWRITNEECPNHVCSSMGWVTVGEDLPIVCLPNEVIVMEIPSD